MKTNNMLLSASLLVLSLRAEAPEVEAVAPEKSEVIEQVEKTKSVFPENPDLQEYQALMAQYIACQEVAFAKKLESMKSASNSTKRWQELGKAVEDINMLVHDRSNLYSPSCVELMEYMGHLDALGYIRKQAETEQAQLLAAEKTESLTDAVIKDLVDAEVTANKAAQLEEIQNNAE